MKPSGFSRRDTLLGVGLLTTAALTLNTGAALADSGAEATSVPADASPATHNRKERRNEQIVVSFVDLGINQKQPQLAADLYVGDLVQHNPNVADGKSGWVAWATGFVAAFPDVNVDFKKVLVDGGFVILHTLITLFPTDRGTAAIDIFRVADYKIVEHWDASTPVPATSANNNGMF